ncbi:MAG: molybdenum cofactor biosynthesis protein MoaE [Chloroflexi bacterium]|nr:molybdenum cofactor biosynthesis protein MoaE [Chloroflexota bacterium]
MKKVTVLFFANLKEHTKTRQVEMVLPEEAAVKDLKADLAKRFPSLERALPSSLVSINQEYAFDDDLLPADAEVAIFPPVSGGEGYPTILRITEDVLDLNQVVQQITSETTGAACCFTGVVRGKTTRSAPRETIHLEYEAYTPMALAKMQQVADEIRSKWQKIEGITIIQRIGNLDPGTPTVAIACSAAHRDEGVFEAARYGIDRLKEIVPIWKKEINPLGEIWVEGEYIPTREDHS